ncbi:MAG TPA: hypothetical protein VFT30_08080, partial [Nitrospira sp.]|nr:hypothetical protein [Nitrospira sp.]
CVRYRRGARAVQHNREYVRRVLSLVFESVERVVALGFVRVAVDRSGDLGHSSYALGQPLRGRHCPVILIQFWRHPHAERGHEVPPVIRWREDNVSQHE